LLIENFDNCYIDENVEMEDYEENVYHPESEKSENT